MARVVVIINHHVHSGQKIKYIFSCAPYCVERRTHSPLGLRYANLEDFETTCEWFLFYYYLATLPKSRVRLLLYVCLRPRFLLQSNSTWELYRSVIWPVTRSICRHFYNKLVTWRTIKKKKIRNKAICTFLFAGWRGFYLLNQIKAVYPLIELPYSVPYILPD